MALVRLKSEINMKFVKTMIMVSLLCVPSYLLAGFDSFEWFEKRDVIEASRAQNKEIRSSEHVLTIDVGARESVAGLPIEHISYYFEDGKLTSGGYKIEGEASSLTVYTKSLINYFEQRAVNGTFSVEEYSRLPYVDTSTNEIKYKEDKNTILKDQVFDLASGDQVQLRQIIKSKGKEKVITALLINVYPVGSEYRLKNVEIVRDKEF
jgi:hypothetical protein